MPLLDLDVLPAAVQAYATAPAGQGITWQVHRGPAHATPQAAWVEAETPIALGRLTVWDDGSIHLEVGHVGTTTARTAHGQLQGLAEVPLWIARLAAWVSQ